MHDTRIRIALAALVVVVAMAPADAAVREFVYLKIDGIEGNVTSAACPKCIRAFSASFTLTLPEPGPGPMEGPKYGNLLTTKRFDSSSAKLLATATQGKKFGVVVKFVRSYDAGPYVYAELKLENASIGSLNVDGGGGVRPVETHSFAYDKLCLRTRGGTPDKPGPWENAQCILR